LPTDAEEARVSELHEPGVLAAGEEQVRQYLRGLGMPEPDVSVYVDEARRGPGPATFSFGTDDEGLIPQLRLSCEGSQFILTHEPLG
jgi:hypothetical protein